MAEEGEITREDDGAEDDILSLEIKYLLPC